MVQRGEAVSRALSARRYFATSPARGAAGTAAGDAGLSHGRRVSAFMAVSNLSRSALIISRDIGVNCGIVPQSRQGVAARLDVLASARTSTEQIQGSFIMRHR